MPSGPENIRAIRSASASAASTRAADFLPSIGQSTWPGSVMAADSPAGAAAAGAAAGRSGARRLARSGRCAAPAPGSTGKGSRNSVIGAVSNSLAAAFGRRTETQQEKKHQRMREQHAEQCRCTPPHHCWSLTAFVSDEFPAVPGSSLPCARRATGRRGGLRRVPAPSRRLTSCAL